MKVVYHHHRSEILGAKGGTTICMEEIPLEMFNEMSNEHILEAAIGIAKCSNKDNYNKKIGRAIAKARLHDVELEVIATSHWHRPDERAVKEVILKTPNGEFLTLRHTAGNKTVHLLDYDEKSAL